jgi:predicted RNA binding protein YcfA (HicA-like mRNA interferase family)
MSRTLQRTKIIRTLPTKGFRKVNADHIYFFHEHEGKETGIKTFVSHSDKEISGDLITSMRRQLKLDKTSDVVALVECPMEGEDYLNVLRAKGLIRSR